MTECKNCIKKDVCDRDVGHGYNDFCSFAKEATYESLCK